MATSFAKLVASNPLKPRSIALFRPVARIPSRFCSTKTNIDQVNNNLTLEGRWQEDTFHCIQDIYKRPFCSRLSATRNLARLLNQLDAEIHAYPACECLRWDVMEDAKALYLIRDMSDTTGTIEPGEYTNFNYDAGRSDVFGCVRVYDWTYLIRIVVGQKGPTPGITYGGFLICIELPENVFVHQYKVRTMNVMNGVLKITIPKQEDKWIHTIKTKIDIFRPL
uniref:uncharacterized protein LOC122584013 n=1 Tax=Erigeron canadensis TaxID=72917 RepID=UPI001CB8D709|nr:uncharacterized protein LOC122584013 [Erigeron canadensis]